jgi:hypothetical protein
VFPNHPASFFPSGRVDLVVENALALPDLRQNLDYHFFF